MTAGMRALLRSPTQSWRLLGAWAAMKSSPHPAPLTPRARLCTSQEKSIKNRLDDVLARTASRVVQESKMRELCQFYSGLVPQEKLHFLEVLSADYGTEQPTVMQLAASLQAAQERGAGVVLRVEERLRHALVPRYQTLFTQISRLPHGVKFLVDLRTDVLGLCSGSGVSPHLQAMNLCLRDLLTLWFSVGFCQLERITWESPCDMLQKISEYEAVHPIRSWPDLKRRVGPYRRCFIFTHSSMPREPVVILHTALTPHISHSIQTLVTSARQTEENSDTGGTEDTDKITTAMFYSITSTQRGLSGVELGNYLIKTAVKELLLEFPTMHQFSSLSPVPGFRDWLVGEINLHLHGHGEGESPTHSLLSDDHMTQLREVLPPRPHPLEAWRTALLSSDWLSHPDQVRAFEAPLLALCARYLYREKHRGFALNPVAHFHLCNGAVLWRINWLGDRSARGLANSCGLMVNYRYFLDQTEANSGAYMERQRIAVSEQVTALLPDQSTS